MKKRTTIKDVAKKAETSVSVVSYVLNNTPGKTISDATKKRVLDAADSLNYIPNSAAQNLRTGNTKTIALFAFWNTDDRAYTTFLKGLTYTANKFGYTVMLCDSASPSKQKIKRIVARLMPSAIIVLMSGSPYINYKEEDIISALGSIKLPSLIINGERSYKDKNIDSINLGFYESSYAATEYLINKGCKKIAYIKPKEDFMNENYRIKGYEAALSKNGLNGHSVVSEENIEKLFSKNLPDGIVANKSENGYLALKMAKKHKISVPSKLKVIAANTENFANYTDPPLTTVALPLEEIGQSAAIKVINKLNEKEIKLPKLKYDIIKRESV